MCGQGVTTVNKLCFVLAMWYTIGYNVNMKQINNNWTIAALAVDVIVACVGFLCVLGCLVKIALYLAEIN